MLPARFQLDAELPARMGEPGLCAPSEQNVLAICREHLSMPDAAQAICTHARWKRGTSLATSWSVQSSLGSTAQIVLKRYALQKAALLAMREQLPGQVVLADQGFAAWRFPTDRELPGLARLFDMHRTTRLLHRLMFLDPWVARWSSSNVETLRYKPENRAVLRLDLDVRFGNKDGLRSRRLVGARALRVSDALRNLELRAFLEHAAGHGPWPRLLGGQARTGLVFEQWLSGTVGARDDFRHAFEAGGLLRDLHTRSLPGPLRKLSHEPRVVSDLFDGDGTARSLAGRIPAPRRSRNGWIHGDVHPDQLLMSSEDGRARLLDLDNLNVGDPHRDLACWIADQLSQTPNLSLEDAANALLAGYGYPIDTGTLRENVAFELSVLAAGALRRLEPRAQERANSLLERAVDLLPQRARAS